MKPREEEVRELLNAKLKVTHLEFEDQSHLHSSHMQIPKHGGSHVALLLVSEDFVGLSRVERSRLVYEILGDLLATRGLHALTMSLLSPSEHKQTQIKGSQNA